MKIALLMMIAPAAALVIAGYATVIGFVLMLVTVVFPNAGEEILAPVNNAAGWLRV